MVPLQLLVEQWLAKVRLQWMQAAEMPPAREGEQAGIPLTLAMHGRSSPPFVLLRFEQRCVAFCRLIAMLKMCVACVTQRCLFFVVDQDPNAILCDEATVLTAKMDDQAVPTQVSPSPLHPVCPTLHHHVHP